MITYADRDEWLEADGLGGFASGTVGGVRTRRYHALLLAARTPPTGRVVIVNGLDVSVEIAHEKTELSSQMWASGARTGGAATLESFVPEPWPTWTWALPGGAKLSQEIFAVHGQPIVVVEWRLLEARKDAWLNVRPFLSGRDYHALHHENGAFRFEPIHGTFFKPYDSVPGVRVVANGRYHHEPFWYRGFLYEEERARGLDHLEDLGSPGTFGFDLSEPAVMILVAEGADRDLGGSAQEALLRLRNVERDRRRFPSRLHHSADDYVVARGAGKTIVAGYPWFTDWGRDTFISMRGLCLATGRIDDAKGILLAWAGEVSQGMLPNRFADQGPPEFNSVDAALWYVIAAYDFYKKTGDLDTRIRGAIERILDGYSKGTRHGIREDADGLLAAGEPGQQLTWMDARVGDRTVTPRIGKPVEIQALWINCLKIGAELFPAARWGQTWARALASFHARFHAPGGWLHDVVDVDHRPGTVDPSFRPNQIFAIGGLPFPLLEGEEARAVVDLLEQKLATPFGLRSLAPDEPGYIGRYEGGVTERDGAYHQGTVWPWLAGPFVEAWVRVRGGTAAAKEEAKKKYLEPLLAHRDEAGIGHVSEICDAEPPHHPKGCPFQAWSVGETIRLALEVLA